MSKRVVAVVGSYRRGGTIDTAVAAILEGARSAGASTETIFLTEKHVEFCTNCRSCVQDPGPERGKCVQRDDLESLLEQIDTADAVILASPVNCFNVTAIFRRFMERLVGYACWPWGRPAPKFRTKVRHMKAVLVASSAMPAILLPVCTGAARALRNTARVLGAKPVAKLWIGLAAQQEAHVPPRTLAKARRMGSKLAASLS